MKIVALIEAMTPEQDKLFLKYIKSQGFGYWHWIDGSWLMTKTQSDVSCIEAIRDELQKIAPGKNTLVFEVDLKSNWAGYGPNTEANNMFSWLNRNWNT